jgi:L-alanine-DL-glutamate epimerase-like enolase superfamily enzyme
LAAATLYLEQPLPRDIALASDVRELAQFAPLVIDESDATFDAFARRVNRATPVFPARAAKAIYKTFVNAARCAYGHHGERRS